MPAIARRLFIPDAPAGAPGQVLGIFNDGTAGWQSFSQAVVSVTDYGATGNGSTDDTAALLAATNDARNRGKRLWAPSGTYKVTGPITDIANPNPLVLAGDGELTIFDASSVSSTLTVMPLSGSVGAPVSTTADPQEGATTLTVTNTAAFTVGQYVHVQSSDPTQSSTGQLNGEINRVYAINAGANQLTVYVPLSAGYSTYLGTAPQVRPITPLQGVSLKGFKILGPANTTVAVIGIQLFWTEGFEIESIACWQTHNTAVQLLQSGNGSVLKSDFRDLLFTGTGYGCTAGYACHDITIQGLTGINMRDLVGIGGGATNPGGWPHRITTENCNLYGGNWGGFNCHPCGYEIDFVDCHVHGSTNAVASTDLFVFNGASGKIIGCSADYAPRHACNIQPATKAATSVIVEDFTARYPAQDGIAVAPVPGYDTGDFVSIRGAHLVAAPGNTHAAIDIQGATNVRVTGIRARGFQNGISVDAASSNILAPSSESDFDGCTNPYVGSIVDFLYWDAVRSSDCSTMPRAVAQIAIGSITSGNWYGAYAVSRTARAYTQIRFCVGTTAPGGTYTDFRAAVCDASGNILAQTANAAATVTTASTAYTLPFLQQASSGAVGPGTITTIPVAALTSPLPTGAQFQIAGDTNYPKILFTTTAPAALGATSLAVTTYPLTVPIAIAAGALVQRLEAGQPVWLGFAHVATTTLTMRGGSTVSGLNGQTPKLATSAVGTLVTGNPLTNPGAGGSTGQLTWMELI